jgi:hypothetical protein
MLLLPLDYGLGLWRLHIVAVQVKRPWEFMTKGLDYGFGLCMLHIVVVQVKRLWEFMAKG